MEDVAECVVCYDTKSEKIIHEESQDIICKDRDNCNKRHEDIINTI